MTVLQNEQLFLLKQMIDKMLDLLKMYDVFKSAKFQPLFWKQKFCFAGFLVMKFMFLKKRKKL